MEDILILSIAVGICIVIAIGLIIANALSIIGEHIEGGHDR